MPFKYTDVRKSVSAISGMTNPNIIYDLTVADSGIVAGSYILFQGSLLRITSPVSVPVGMATGRVFRAGDYEYRYLGSHNGRPLLEEIGANFVSRLQVRHDLSEPGSDFIPFDLTDFGPSDYVDYNQGQFTLASGISHLMEAGAFKADRACTLQWTSLGISGSGTPVGSYCGSLGSGLVGGSAVYTVIPTADTDYRLHLSDPSAIITGAWATISSQHSFQTVFSPTTPTGVVTPPDPVPSGTVPPSGAAPPPSGTPFMGVSYNASGWTTFATSGTTLYVSSISGSDSNDGLSTGSPKATLLAAVNLLSNGNHAIYLARGGTYSHPNSPGSASWSKQGLSRKYPLLISAYGVGAQPIVNTFQAINYPMYYVALVDLNLTIPRAIKGGNGVLFERCTLKAVDIQGDRIDSSNWLTPLTGLFIRFCKILDSNFAGTGLWHGLYTVNVFEIVCEYNVWDHNGWTAGFSRDDPNNGATQHKHNFYNNLPGGPSIFRFNFVSDASSHAIHQRVGGVNEWNLYVSNPMMQMGYGFDGKVVYAPNGVSGYISNNVAVTAADTSSGFPRGMFLYLANVNGVTVANNIACFNGTSSANNVFCRLDTGPYVITNVAFNNNISHQWDTSTGSACVHTVGTGQTPTNISQSGNQFETGSFPSASGALAYSGAAFIAGMRASGIGIGTSTDPTLIINNIKAMFT